MKVITCYVSAMFIARVCNGKECEDTLEGEDALQAHCPNQWCQTPSPYSTEQAQQVRRELAVLAGVHSKLMSARSACATNEITPAKVLTEHPLLCIEIHEKLTTISQATSELLTTSDSNILFDALAGALHASRYCQYASELDTTQAPTQSPARWRLLHPLIVVKRLMPYRYCNFYTGTQAVTLRPGETVHRNTWCERGEDVLCESHRAWLFFTELAMAHHGLAKCAVVLCLNFIVPGYEVLVL
jgi:hypothetical protein